MERCEDFLAHWVDLAEGGAIPDAAARHLDTCVQCRHEVALQKEAAAYLSRPVPEAALSRPFLVPVMARRRDRRAFAIAGAVLAVLFLGMHSLLDLDPYFGVLGSFGFLGPFSRTLLQNLGLGVVGLLVGTLGFAVWGLRKILQRQ
jgi:hypothetical protein